jgi:alpha-glucosidase (family GH31 glycosyl hydrolase)
MTVRLLFAALLVLAGPARALDSPEALALRSAGVSGRVSLTAEGALRFTASSDGAPARRVPSAIELPAARVPGSGRYSLSADEGGAVWVSAEGQRVVRVAFEAVTGGELRARLDFEGSTAFHGMGQAAPVLALRDERFELVHTPKFGDQTYLYIPFFFSDAGLAVYANAESGDFIRFEKGARATLASASGTLDFYLFGPGTPSALVSRFYALSNSKSLLPRWAYGYLQSRYGYRTDDEVRRTVSMAERQGIPLSAIVLDLYWFKRMGDLDWNHEAFPDPRGLADWLEAQNVKLITISEPFIARDSKSFGELEDAGALAHRSDGGTMIFSDWWDFGQAGGGIIDPSRESAAALLGNKYEALLRTGVDGFWIDLGEPERVPREATFGSWPEAEYHDFFNLAWARIVRASFEKAAPGRRPFILSRSGWTGIAGLGVATWSGDVPATWEGLQAQVPLGLNASLSGLPFWGSDVGGFFSEGGELMPPDPELLLRWQQFGAFTPIDRAHGHGPREPWIYGPQWQARIKRAITLRASLLPYLYSTAWQVTSQGLPMMRPLFFLEPKEPKWQGEEAEFLLGDSVLVAPVLEALEKATKKTVRLPTGRWYDAFTLAPLEGGAELVLDVTLDTFPVYFREGAIVPMQREGGGEAVLLLPGAAPSSFTIFSDDGLTEAYRSGAGEKLLVRLEAKAVTFSGAAKAREVTLLFPRGLALPALDKKAPRVEGPYKLVKISLKAGTTRLEL